MSRQRRFKQGRKVTTVRQLMGCYGRREWIYYRHKPLHWGWWTSMPLHALGLAVARGFLRHAVEVNR